MPNLTFKHPEDHLPAFALIRDHLGSSVVGHQPPRSEMDSGEKTITIQMPTVR